MSLVHHNFKFENTDCTIVAVNDDDPDFEVFPLWFMAYHFAFLLGYKDLSTRALCSYISPVNRTCIREYTPLFVNESGIKELVIQSTVAGKKSVQRWCSKTVFPTIRKLINPLIVDTMGTFYVATSAHMERCNLYKIGVSMAIECKLVALNNNTNEEMYFKFIHSSKCYRKLFHNIKTLFGCNVLYCSQSIYVLSEEDVKYIREIGREICIR